MIHPMCAQNVTLARRMGIAFAVRLLMMDAVRCDPEDRPAFERERSARREDVFDPLMSLVAAVREQAMVPHADPEHARNQPEGDGRDDRATASTTKNAATAPTWNAVIAVTVIELIPF